MSKFSSGSRMMGWYLGKGNLVHEKAELTKLLQKIGLQRNRFTKKSLPKKIPSPKKIPCCRKSPPKKHPLPRKMPCQKEIPFQPPQATKSRTSKTPTSCCFRLCVITGTTLCNLYSNRTATSSTLSTKRATLCCTSHVKTITNASQNFYYGVVWRSIRKTTGGILRCTTATHTTLSNWQVRGKWQVRGIGEKLSGIGEKLSGLVKSFQGWCHLAFRVVRSFHRWWGVFRGCWTGEKLSAAVPHPVAISLQYPPFSYPPSPYHILIISPLTIPPVKKNKTKKYLPSPSPRHPPGKGRRWLAAERLQPATLQGYHPPKSGQRPHSSPANPRKTNQGKQSAELGTRRTSAAEVKLISLLSHVCCPLYSCWYYFCRTSVSLTSFARVTRMTAFVFVIYWIRYFLVSSQGFASRYKLFLSVLVAKCRLSSQKWLEVKEQQISGVGVEMGRNHPRKKNSP